MTDFGGKLRRARERRGMSLGQIAAHTRIPLATLDALERNDFRALPGGIFSRGFVRSFASEVGLDPEAMVREFVDECEERPTEAHDAERAPDESEFESRRRMAGVLAKVVLISIPFVALLLYVSFRPVAGRGEVAADQVVAGSPGPAGGPLATDAPAEAEAVALARETGTTGGALQLELHPTGPCWVSLTIDGQRVLARLLQPGERIVREVRELAIVEVGDAGAFAFTIDGRPGRSLGRSGQVRTVRITPATAADYIE